MSKLDELLRELCPNGVEHKRIGDFAMCFPGATPKTTHPEYWENGTIPWMSSGEVNQEEVTFTEKKITQKGYDATSTKMVPANTVVIALAGQGKTRGSVAITRISLCTNQSLCAIVTDETVLSEYLFHYMRSQYLKLRDLSAGNGTRGGLNMKMIESYLVPVPPVEIQSEIVGILNGFTNLLMELSAELTARKTQYRYYRDKMLTFGDDDKFKWENLGDVCDILTGYPFDSSQFQVSGVRLMRGMNIKRGNLFFSEEINRYWNSADGLEKYLLKENDIVIAMDGSLVGKSFGIVQAEYLPLLLVQRVARIRSKQVNNRYIYHYIACRFPSYVEKKKTGGAIPHVSQKDIASFRVPIPSADVQNRIVNVLDNFEKICSDLNIGLPAEIEARQKQYEYYRDKLLTFAETGNTILSRAEQSRAEQSRAEQSRAEQSRALIKLLQYVFGYAVVTLEDIAENCDSMRKPVTSGKREAGKHPYYGASGIVDYVKDYIFDGDYLLVSEDGANLLARSTPIAFSISGKNWVNNHAHVLKFDCYETRRFVEFYLNSIDLTPYISGGAQPKLNQKNLNQIEIPLPSQERQKYIVDILDRFDAICNDLTSGLPAEIEARQKQYEYYRDKLLTFKEVAET